MSKKNISSDSVPTGALDMEDERLHNAEHVLGAVFEGELPKSVNLMNIKAHDQKFTNHCTSYGLTHIHEILNTVEYKEEMKFDPEQQWKHQLEYPGTAKESVGDYLVSALKSLHKFGLDRKKKNHPIIRYAKFHKSVDQMKRYLAAGMPIYTGAPTTSTNFKLAKHNGVWGGLDGAKIGGHAFAVVGYEPGYFIALNSYGETWGKFGNGTFKIREKDIFVLYSAFVIYDAQDLRLIFKDVSERSDAAEVIEWALEKKIIRGYGDEDDAKKREFRPNNPVTRAEMAYIARNIFQALKKELTRS